MRLDHVLTQLDAAAGLLAGADPQTFEQTETHLKAALDELRALTNEPRPGPDDLNSVHAQCRRAAGLVAAAEDFYLGLVSVMNIQAMGYGTACARPQTQPGKRFAVDA
jgi:hypothetical protein